MMKHLSRWALAEASGRVVLARRGGWLSAFVASAEGGLAFGHWERHLGSQEERRSSR